MGLQKNAVRWQALSMDQIRELAVREALFLHLERLMAESRDGTVGYKKTARFQFGDESIAMRQIQGRGIHKPASLSAALSITTTYTKPGQKPPYEDLVGSDGYARYKYQGTDPNHPSNRALRTCLEYQLPLAYFIGVAEGVYLVEFPVFLIAEDPQLHEFTLSFDRSEVQFDPSRLTSTERRYALRQTKARIHQPVFRQRVLRAYQTTCAICRLKHVELLDAAHIISDSQPNGEPIIPNGIAMCKIHHAAYDRNLLGIRPNYQVEINAELLLEIDGPMLKHGLQEMNGQKLLVPSSAHSRPDPERLQVRYEEFKNAS
jgi:putative restriction endonuclease